MRDFLHEYASVYRQDAANVLQKQFSVVLTTRCHVINSWKDSGGPVTCQLLFTNIKWKPTGRRDLLQTKINGAMIQQIDVLFLFGLARKTFSIETINIFQAAQIRTGLILISNAFTLDYVIIRLFFHHFTNLTTSKDDHFMMCVSGIFHWWMVPLLEIRWFYEECFLK